MKITDVLPGYIFETKKVEYKQRLSSPNPITWIKTVAAFANCDGGNLVVGVDDNRELCGFAEDEIDSEIRKINNMINSKIEPNILFDYAYVPYKEENNKRYIIIIKIAKSKRLPVVVKEDRSNTIYVRDEGATILASPEQIRNLIISSEAITNDEVDTMEKFNPSDFTKLYETYEENTGERLTEKRLASINFFNSDRYLKKGSLLFKDSCSSSNTMVHCRLWDGLNKGSSIVLDNKEEKGNLLELLNFSLKFINSNTRTGFIKKSVGRDTIVSYPRRAITEAVVNALVHRNYMITGTQIDIDIFKNRLEITSPGSLLGGSFKDKETNLKAIPSKIRNQLICDVFAICRLMEKSGSGFEKIVDDYSNYDDRFKPFIECTNDYFTITLMDVLYDGVNPVDEKFSFVPISGGNKDNDYKILLFCLDEYKSSAEIAKMIGIKRSSYFMNKYMKHLVDNEYLLPYTNESNSASQKYITNRSKLIFK